MVNNRQQIPFLFLISFASTNHTFICSGRLSFLFSGFFIQTSVNFTSKVALLFCLFLRLSPVIFISKLPQLSVLSIVLYNLSPSSVFLSIRFRANTSTSFFLASINNCKYHFLYRQQLLCSLHLAIRFYYHLSILSI